MLSSHISDFGDLSTCDKSLSVIKTSILIFGLYAQDFYEFVQKQNLKIFSLKDTSGTKMEKFLNCASTFSFQVC